jgi:hypothetical protein
MNTFIISVTSANETDRDTPSPVYLWFPFGPFITSTSMNHCTEKTWVCCLGLLEVNIRGEFQG